MKDVSMAGVPPDAAASALCIGETDCWWLRMLSATRQQQPDDYGGSCAWLMVVQRLAVVHCRPARLAAPWP